MNLIHSINNWPKIWSIIRRKAPFLFHKTCNVPDNGPNGEGLYNENDAFQNVLDLERQLKVESSNEILENISKEHLHQGAKSFLYLNLCSNLLRPWYEFYVDLFKNKSPSQIVVTMNRILKGSNKAKNLPLETIAKRLFGRISSVLALKYQTIKNMTKGISPEVQFENEGLHKINNLHRINNLPLI